MTAPPALHVFRWTADQAERVDAYQVTPAADTTGLRAPVEIERHEIDLAIECIGCGMCVSACTMVGHNDRFPGPAALNRALTLELDHRDAGREGRWRVLLGDDALARCHGQGNCTEVCPMSLSP